MKKYIPVLLALILARMVVSAASADDGCPEPGTPQCQPPTTETPPPNQEDLPCDHPWSLCYIQRNPPPMMDATPDPNQPDYDDKPERGKPDKHIMKRYNQNRDRTIR